MKRIIQILFLLAFQVALLVSCEKVPAIDVDEQFIGTWKHNVDANNTIYLGIKSDYKGFIERYENGKFKSDTQRRKWLIKKDKLHFGWMSAKYERFTIDAYPTVATTIIIHNLDTIQVGDRYVILDGKYYGNKS
jgi:hypothetical protein